MWMSGTHRLLQKISLSLSLSLSLKVGVPENAVRKSDRVMEEFHIPHSSAPPPPVGEERVRIAEIDDDLIQIAFQGQTSVCCIMYGT